MTVAYFGKLPTRGDFVRLHASGTEAVGLDSWVQEGLHHGQSRVPGWPARYEAAPPVHFVFPSSPNGSCLIGVLYPSRDRSGRLYPFMVFTRADGEAATGSEWPRLPEQFASFLAQAHRFAAKAVHNVDGEDLARELDVVQQVALARSDAYGVFVRTMPICRWEARLGWTDGAWPHLEPLVATLATLGAARVERYADPLRLPLAGDVRTVASEVGFWVDVCQRAVGSTALRPFLFWTSPAGPSPAELHVHLKRPAASALSRMLVPSLPDERSLIVPGNGSRAPAPGAPPAGHEPGVVLHDLLQRVSQVARTYAS